MKKSVICKRIVTLVVATVWLLPCRLVVAEEQTDAPQDNAKVVRDLRYGESLYNFYQGKYFSAITNLLIARQTGSLQKQGNEAEIFLGGLYLAYGLHQQAGEIFERLIDASTQVDAATRGKAWFYLGKTRYRRGMYDAAAAALQHAKNTLPPSTEAERLNILANIYLHKQEYRKAGEILESFDTDTAWKAYTQFNLGVSLVRQNRLDEGITLLDGLGRLSSGDQELRALRDRANLALGFAQIRINQPQNAGEYFKRVRLHGPQTNKALLGLGWSYESAQAYRRALVPWMEIQEKNILDPAVQEVLLAIPYVLEKLDKKKLALVHYNNAVTRYEEQLQRIKAIAAAIKKGELLRALRPENTGEESVLPRYNTSLPDSITVPYLYSLMASHQFQQANKQYQDLLYLQYVLNRWQQHLPVYKLMLAERRKSYQQKLPKIKSYLRLSKYEKLQKKRDRLFQKYQQIMARNDELALASREEKKRLTELERIKKKINRLGNKVAAETKEKYHLLHGLLLWDVSKKYAARLWQVKKQLQELDELLRKSELARASLQQARQRAPQGFRGYDQRIRLQIRRINRLKKDLAKVIGAQEQIIEALALDELKRQRARLKNYNLRANFALARIYDSLAKSGDGIQ